jgi:hypothetical protein
LLLEVRRQNCSEIEIHKVRRLALVSGFVLVFAVSATWAKQIVRGTIDRVEGQTLVVKLRDGVELKVVLADTRLSSRARIEDTDSTIIGNTREIPKFDAKHIPLISRSGH